MVCQNTSLFYKSIPQLPKFKNLLDIMQGYYYIWNLLRMVLAWRLPLLLRRYVIFGLAPMRNHTLEAYFLFVAVASG